MKLSILAALALSLATGAHAGTPTQYSETYDAEGNRTWTKYDFMAPKVPDLTTRPVQDGAGQTSASGLLAFPVVGIEAPEQENPYQGFQVEAGDLPAQR